MYQQQPDILMNFRIPTDLKSNFDQICRHHHVSMTSRLNILVRDFVHSEMPKLPKPSKSNNNSSTQAFQDAHWSSPEFAVNWAYKKAV